MFIKNIVSDYEILVVNDGSYDNTRAFVEKIMLSNYHIKLINHLKNKGYGNALRSGFKEAKYDWIFFTDSDLQFDIHEIVNFIDHVDSNRIVIGFRKNRKDAFHRIGNATIYNKTLNILFGLTVRDVDCAYKLFPKSLLEKILLKSNGALINAELLIKARQAGFEFKEIEVSHFPRISGKSSGANPRVIAKAFQEILLFKLNIL